MTYSRSATTPRPRLVSSRVEVWAPGLTPATTRTTPSTATTAEAAMTAVEPQVRPATADAGPVTWLAQLPWTSRAMAATAASTPTASSTTATTRRGDGTARAAAQAARAGVGRCSSETLLGAVGVEAGDAEERDLEVETVHVDPGQLLDAADDVVRSSWVVRRMDPG